MCRNDRRWCLIGGSESLARWLWKLACSEPLPLSVSVALFFLPDMRWEALFQQVLCTMKLQLTHTHWSQSTKNCSLGRKRNRLSFQWFSSGIWSQKYKLLWKMCASSGIVSIHFWQCYLDFKELWEKNGKVQRSQLGGGRDLEDYKQSFMTNSGVRSTCENANSNIDADTVFLKCEMGTRITWKTRSEVIYRTSQQITCLDFVYLPRVCGG